MRTIIFHGSPKSDEYKEGPFLTLDAFSKILEKTDHAANREKAVTEELRKFYSKKVKTGERVSFY